ncbi:Oidioi.mRNA.OKI2018_I69.PAR.g12950.t1.cds [Oikopleura dioica]|uniref:Oidioi.mRNA.OKI2018_I69.PAR.g12950.t1.cds n=1 Tax=Oikopleura dioica TaxID=34765 RepID=A0ABN7S8N4_OIKDI|nr:Oidioi.mRNA.OKI2018_I69.PAR.g12950.t1.cds [Oikopleura dioica]
MKLLLFPLLVSAYSSAIPEENARTNEREWRLARLREISSNATTSNDATAFLYMILRQPNAADSVPPFQLSDPLPQLDGSAALFARAKEIGKNLKEALLNSDLDDDSILRAHIEAAGNELQEMIDEIFNESELGRTKREVAVMVGTMVVGTVSAPVAAVGAAAVAVAGFLFDWW